MQVFLSMQKVVIGWFVNRNHKSRLVMLCFWVQNGESSEIPHRDPYGMDNLINILCSSRIVFIHRLQVKYATPHISIVLTIIFLPRMAHFIIFCYLEMVIGELLSLFWTECIFNKFIVYKYYHIVISPLTIHIRKATTTIWMHIDILLWYIYIYQFLCYNDGFIFGQC